MVRRSAVSYAAEPNRTADRARRRSASTSRSRGVAVVTSSDSSFSVASATAATARSQASAFAFDGFCIPLTFRTYWMEARWISSNEVGGSKL